MAGMNAPAINPNMAMRNGGMGMMGNMGAMGGMGGMGMGMGGMGMMGNNMGMMNNMGGGGGGSGSGGMGRVSLLLNSTLSGLTRSHREEWDVGISQMHPVDQPPCEEVVVRLLHKVKVGLGPRGTLLKVMPGPSHISWIE